MASRTQQRQRIGLTTLAVGVCATILLASCTGGGESAATTTVVAATTTTIGPPPNDGVLSLGVFLPSTGQGASLGGPMIDAVESAVVHINQLGGVLGQDVRLTVTDEAAGTGLEELLIAGVDAIIGPASSLVALSQLDATVDPTQGVVTCSPSATALALDAYPDNGYFFRTAPSDSLQMVAISRQAEQTGVSSVSIGYLDDPYGRGLRDALTDDIISRDRLDIIAEVAFSGGEEDLSGTARALLASSPGAIVLLGDADDGGRLLAALDDASSTSVPPQVIVNDTIRTARQVFEELTPVLRQRTTGIAPSAVSIKPGDPDGSYTAHAQDCVNLIALAAIRAESDSPSVFRRNIAAVSVGGRGCTSFEICVRQIEQNLQIDYNGKSGAVDLSPITGDPVRAWFVAFGFDDEGHEIEARRFEVP